MSTPATADDVIQLAKALSPSEKRKFIQKLSPDLKRALTAGKRPRDLDDEYERGYKKMPESTADLEALLPHLPLPRERW